MPFRLECERGDGNTPSPRGPSSLGGRGRGFLAGRHEDPVEEVRVLRVPPEEPEVPALREPAALTTEADGDGVLRADMRREERESGKHGFRIVGGKPHRDALALVAHGDDDRERSNLGPCLAERRTLKKRLCHLKPHSAPRGGDSCGGIDHRSLRDTIRIPRLMDAQTIDIPANRVIGRPNSIMGPLTEPVQPGLPIHL